MNKRFFSIMILALCCAIQAAAQAMIVFQLKPNDQADMAENVRKQLDMKIQQALTRQSALQSSEDGVLVVESQLILNSSVPAGMESGGITMARGQLCLNIKNKKDGSVYAQMTKDVHATVQGDMTAAQLEVVKRLNIQDPIWAKFVTNGRAKINEYYKQNGQAIIKKAETMFLSKKFNECKEYLSTIPTTISFYDQVQILNEECSKALEEQN